MYVACHVAVLAHKIPVQPAPFCVTVHAEELIRNQHVRSLGDVTANNPSVHHDALASQNAPLPHPRIFGHPSRTLLDGLSYTANPRRNAIKGGRRADVLPGRRPWPMAARAGRCTGTASGN